MTPSQIPEAAGYPLDGVAVEIVDDQDRPLPTGEVGLVRLRGPTLPAGYLGPWRSGAAADSYRLSSTKVRQRSASA